jgi:hypothetical protein
MSKDNYNFDEIKDESPTIIMGGYTYKLVYPTVEDVEKIQSYKTDEEKTNAVYGFVEKTQQSDPDFKTTLFKQNIKVLKAFTDMIKDEFGVE